MFEAMVLSHILECRESYVHTDLLNGTYVNNAVDSCLSRNYSKLSQVVKGLTKE